MSYHCPRCGFYHCENMGGTLEEAVVAWREYIQEPTP
jgi:hypothetical protein